MGLIGTVGRKRVRARVAMSVVYLVLSVAALTTLYPFFLMVSTGLKGPTDQNDNRLIPAYLQDSEELAKKYIDDKYAGDATLIASTRLGANASEEQVRQYEKFLMDLGPDYFTVGFRTAPNQVTSRLTQTYQAWLRQRFSTIDQLNRTYLEENTSFESVTPPADLLERKQWSPPKDAKYTDWREFKASLPADYRIPVRTTRLYQEFVRAKYRNRFDEVPPAVAGTAKNFEVLKMPDRGPVRAEFEQTSRPDRYRLGSTEDFWAMAAGPGVEMPIAAHEAYVLKRDPGAVRGEFAARNYQYVLSFVLLNGQTLVNTAIFCLLAMATQLIVNPIAAYALSRYPIKASGKILMFLLATMAFPAEVAMIPSFLLLKDLGLLNTFAALVLPTAASGYMIFLLKGFFDSLPQELFEAGQIDGAKESTMLLRIALPLSRPVLGYLALLAFMAAYSAFLYAFLVCQDQRIWTLMVWIYQLQQVAPKSVMMAALTMAALPTLLVFLAAQRVIMRGIVLPGEK